MENIKIEMTEETYGEQNSIFIPESDGVSMVMEISSTELDQSAVDTKADNQKSIEISPVLEEKREDREQGIFGPFSHHMKPDLELIRLVSEKSLNQEAATKLINDRYKLIMEISARRKEKEQRDKIKFTQISQNVDHNDVIKTRQLSEYMGNEDIEKTAASNRINDCYKLIMEISARRKEKKQRDKIKFTLISQSVDHKDVIKTPRLSEYMGNEDIDKTTLLPNMYIAPGSSTKDDYNNVMKTYQLCDYMGNKDIEKTTQLLHNMHLAPGSSTKAQSVEFWDDYLEEMCWHKGLNQFDKSNDIEINTNANISGDGMPNTITEDCECRVEDAYKNMANELIDEGIDVFYQAPRKVRSAKRKKSSQIYFGTANEAIGFSFEELLDYKRSEDIYEL